MCNETTRSTEDFYPGSVLEGRMLHKGAWVAMLSTGNLLEVQDYKKLKGKDTIHFCLRPPQ